jgi:predicted DCC family thiol-disulfide oxidoreductase YuxK
MLDSVNRQQHLPWILPSDFFIRTLIMTASNTVHNREIEVFYDGACPLCRREIAWVQKLDRHQRITFTDIASPNFQTELVGRTHNELMARMYGRLPTGELITGVEVFRKMYGAVGFHKLVSISRWPIVKQLLAACYFAFARLRLKLPKSRCNDQSCSLRDTQHKDGV